MSDLSTVTLSVRSPHPVADPAPSDVCYERQRTIAVIGVVRVINEERPATHVRARNESPIAAVLRVVPVVAHHEEMPCRNDDRPPIIVRRLRRSGAESRRFESGLLLPVEERTGFTAGGGIDRWKNAEPLTLRD